MRMIERKGDDLGLRQERFRASRVGAPQQKNQKATRTFSISGALKACTRACPVLSSRQREAEVQGLGPQLTLSPIIGREFFDAGWFQQPVLI